MPKPRDRRPPRPPQPAASREPMGSPRQREYLYREIEKRLAALHAERDAEQQIALGLATEGDAWLGYVRPSG